MPKSHVLTLKWVMRAPEPATSPATARCCQSDQIVRDAARVVLDHHGPCRVVDGDKLVGVVDDEDILRVVVAEEQTSMTVDTRRRRRLHRTGHLQGAAAVRRARQEAPHRR